MAPVSFIKITRSVFVSACRHYTDAGIQMAVVHRICRQNAGRTSATCRTGYNRQTMHRQFALPPSVPANPGFQNRISLLIFFHQRPADAHSSAPAPAVYRWLSAPQSSRWLCGIVISVRLEASCAIPELHRPATTASDCFAVYRFINHLLRRSGSTLTASSY